MAAGAEVLSTLVQRTVRLGSPKLAHVPWEADDAGSAQPTVVVQVEYVSGVQGLNWLVLEAEGARAIAASMMGEVVGDDVQLDELHLSALAEAMNQMMGASATALSSLLDRPIAISPPTVQLQATRWTLPVLPRTDAAAEGQAVILFFPLHFQDESGALLESHVLQILPADLARRLADDYLRHTAGPEPDGRAIPPEPVPFPSHPAPGRTPEVDRGATDDPTWQALKHLPVTLTVRLGRAWLSLDDALNLTRGSVVPLDVDDRQPVDVLVSGTLIARGEVVVVREHFGVRITEFVRPEEG